MRTDAYILFDAEPFCFGPISTTLNIVRELKKSVNKKDYKCILLGKLTTLQLSKTTDLFDEVIDCNTTDPQDFRKHRELVKNASLFVCNTNFKSLKFISDLGIDVPSIFIDTLFWMWEKIEIDYKKLSGYYIQDFIGIDRQMDRLQLSPDDFTVTGPIINSNLSRETKKKNEILINFGGIENIYNKGGYFIKQLTELIMEVVSEGSLYSDFTISICGGGDEINKLRKTIGNKNIFIGTLPPDDFINKLSECRYFLTLPGLTSFYESVYYKAYTYFLLPQNYSQYLQLKKYNHSFENIHGLNWHDFEGMEKIDEYEEELISVKKIQKCNEVFLTNENFKTMFKASLNAYLRGIEKTSDYQKELTAAESNYQKLFTDQNALASHKIAADICNLLT